MSPAEMWKKFTETQGIPENTEYEAWAFGSAPDKLASLVLSGKKTGTASAYELYEIEKEPLPKAGDYSVILDSTGEAKCVIRTTKTYVSPFCDVSESHARKEGEGDLSLGYWRDVHREFFTECLSKAGLEFDEKMPVLCEEFELIYK